MDCDPIQTTDDVIDPTEPLLVHAGVYAVGNLRIGAFDRIDRVLVRGEVAVGKPLRQFGLHAPTAGRVLIDGIDVRSLALDSIAAAIGVVTQESYLFHDTIAANLWSPVVAQIVVFTMAIVVIRIFPRGIAGRWFGG